MCSERISAHRCPRGSWAGVPTCGMNGALTRAGENEIAQQQHTDPAPLDCQPAARCSKPLDRDEGQELGRRKRHSPIKIGQRHDGSRQWSAAREFFAAGRRALQTEIERRAAPLAMATAFFLRPPTRMSGGIPLGPPANFSCAAAGASSAPCGRCERRDDKIEALQNRSVDCSPWGLTFGHPR